MSVENLEFIETLDGQPLTDPTDSVADAAPVSETVRADTVNLSGGAVTSVHARIVNVDHAGVARVQGDALTVTLKNSGLGAAAADVFDGTFEQSAIGALGARKANLTGGTVTLLAAGQVTLNGDARVFFDMRAGVLAGLLAGGILSAVYTAWRFLAGGKRR